MVLHPQARAFVDTLAQLRSVADPLFGPADVGQRRESASREAAALPRVDIASVMDIDAHGVPCRLYSPHDNRPVIIHLHGGGWVFGDVDTHDPFSRYLAHRTGWSVLTVGYRRAPEHPYPAPLDDCETAARWLRAHATGLGLRDEPLVVLGDSAGGNLAAGLSIRHHEWFAMQVLVYPCLDPTGSSWSYGHEDGGLSGAEMTWYWHAYVPNELDRARPEVAPVRSADPAELPATVVISAEHDPLRDEDETYAARLAAAGVPTVAWRQLGMVHGFWRHPTLFDSSVAAVGQVSAILAGLLTDDLQD